MGKQTVVAWLKVESERSLRATVRSRMWVRVEVEQDMRAQRGGRGIVLLFL
jgi:hypothetical protein